MEITENVKFIFGHLSEAEKDLLEERLIRMGFESVEGVAGVDMHTETHEGYFGYLDAKEKVFVSFRYWPGEFDYFERQDLKGIDVMELLYDEKEEDIIFEEDLY